MQKYCLVASEVVRSLYGRWSAESKSKKINKKKGKKKKTNNTTKTIQPLLLGNVCQKEEKTNKNNNNKNKNKNKREKKKKKKKTNAGPICQ